MQMKPLPPNPKLEALLKASVAKFKAMTPEEQEAMLKAQKESWVRAEMNWPRDCPYR